MSHSPPKRRVGHANGRFAPRMSVTSDAGMELESGWVMLRRGNRSRRPPPTVAALRPARSRQPRPLWNSWPKSPIRRPHHASLARVLWSIPIRVTRAGKFEAVYRRSLCGRRSPPLRGVSSPHPVLQAVHRIGRTGWGVDALGHPARRARRALLACSLKPEGVGM